MHNFKGIRSVICLAATALSLCTFAQAPASTPASDSMVRPAPEPPKKSLTAAEQRQQQLAADTAKLQILAEQLKAEMDKSTKDTLSISVVKKASEVEKLAHKVRDEIRASLVN